MEAGNIVDNRLGSLSACKSDDLTRHLEIVLRYDGHFAREFYRAVRLLIANHPEFLDPCGTFCVGYNRAHVWRLGPEQN
jgi:hypothetical protein